MLRWSYSGKPSPLRIRASAHGGRPGGWLPEFTAITGKALSAISTAMTNATVTNTMMRLIGTTSFDSGRDSSAPPYYTTGARMTRYK